MNKNNLQTNSKNHSDLGLKGLRLLWVGLLIFYFGIFLISVCLTGSLHLFFSLEHNKEGIIISGLLGFIALVIGIKLILGVVLNHSNTKT